MRSKCSQENGQVYQNKNLDKIILLDKGNRGRIRGIEENDGSKVTCKF